MAISVENHPPQQYDNRITPNLPLTELAQKELDQLMYTRVYVAEYPSDQLLWRARGKALPDHVLPSTRVSSYENLLFQESCLEGLTGVHFRIVCLNDRSRKMIYYAQSTMIRDEQHWKHVQETTARSAEKLIQRQRDHFERCKRTAEQQITTAHMVGPGTA